MIMEPKFTLQGRELSPEDIESIRLLIKDNPAMSRRQLSIALCESWDWRNARGQLKDMASRSLMLKLHERGEIVLPERKQIPTNRMRRGKLDFVEHNNTPISEPLNTLMPIRIANISASSVDEALFCCLVSTHHYLGYSGSVGENMKYLIYDRYHRPLACLLFGSSAWSCTSRDKHIGWSAQTRQKNINFTTNNTRFLILPWVKVKCLASHIISKVTRRAQKDWLERYGHPIYLLETFVDQSRYLGTCYKAANWKEVGTTQGRSRNDREHEISVPRKSVYLYPLAKDYRKTLIKPLK